MISAVVPFAAVLFGACRGLAQGIQADFQSADSIKKAAGTIAGDAMNFYEGDQPGHTPGLLFLDPDPNPWWWAGGVLFATMAEYWHYTQDSQYNEVVKEAMVHQAGANQDFLTPNWTAHMGNDDQGFWGVAAMTAAEVNFDNPAPGDPQWLATAQGVFNTMATHKRWDETCGGGLRWQLNLYAQGYNYKNSISNGLFFNLGARLARYTGNETFSEWANRVWDWERSVGLISDTFAVYDGASINEDCKNINKAEYTYNSGIFLQGAAFLYNHTNGAPQWRERVSGLLDHMLATFFPKNIAVEITCQNDEKNLCVRDQLLHKGVVHRWLVTVAQVAPFTNDKIAPVLRASGEAALRQCNRGDNGRLCGFQWTSGQGDAAPNVGTQMTALSAVISTLYNKEQVSPPVTHDSGGTSEGDNSAGSEDTEKDMMEKKPITTAGKAGASILTLMVVVGFCSVLGWMIV
ncbi:hypothetical protein CDD81_3419 [Ophiocordyceps australis]|uniref:Mannan endo-1,6-alpha-mannosidase n=1 Tax=Ophiocordyceps australis TaxID=1399860 RepID=A0A2C5YDS2_9HYPO|nr:hypothetical protein CDD81_3419 [Ophiocordyceps australis]